MEVVQQNRVVRGFQVKFQFEVIAIVTWNFPLQTFQEEYFCGESSGLTPDQRDGRKMEL